MNMDIESLSITTQAYREKALDTFFGGLTGGLPRLVSVTQSTNLQQPLDLGLKLQNLNYETQY